MAAGVCLSSWKISKTPDYDYEQKNILVGFRHKDKWLDSGKDCALG